MAVLTLKMEIERTEEPDNGLFVLQAIRAIWNGGHLVDAEWHEREERRLQARYGTLARARARAALAPAPAPAPAPALPCPSVTVSVFPLFRRWLQTPIAFYAKRVAPLQVHHHLRRRVPWAQRYGPSMSRWRAACLPG